MQHRGDTIEVETWDQLQESLFHDDWADDLQRFRSSYVYRGLDDISYPLTTSLNRQGESHLEKHLLRNFIKYSKIDDDVKSVWKWLAIAQHHGLPTRLLDWTYSPLVAVHFAVSDYSKFDRDGIVWAVNYLDSQKYLPINLAAALDLAGSYIFTAEMLHEYVGSLERLESLNARVPYAVFFEPPSIDDRIVNQYAVFSMMSDPSLVISD